MQIILDQEQQNEIQKIINAGIAKAVKQATNKRPFYNRKEIASYLGVSPETITNWAKLGMPVSIIDGRKIYVTDSVINWVKSKEVQNKKP